MADRKIILLHGEVGVGKDAVADILVRNHGFKRYAFADELKRACLDLDPMVTLIFELADGEQQPQVVRLSDVINAHGWDKAKHLYPEVRRTQQRLATEVFRNHVSQEYWADIVYDAIRHDPDQAPAVVTDTRFEQEETVGRELYPELQVWWIKRPNNPYALTGENAAHISEQWHPEQFEFIVNDGSLARLEREVAFRVSWGPESR